MDLPQDHVQWQALLVSNAEPLGFATRVSNGVIGSFSVLHKMMKYDIQSIKISDMFTVICY